MSRIVPDPTPPVFNPAAVVKRGGVGVTQISPDSGNGPEGLGGIVQHQLHQVAGTQNHYIAPAAQGRGKAALQKKLGQLGTQ